MARAVLAPMCRHLAPINFRFAMMERCADTGITLKSCPQIANHQQTDPATLTLILMIEMLQIRIFKKQTKALFLCVL